jgi:hypothetical protein
MCLLGLGKKRNQKTYQEKYSFHGASIYLVDENGVASHGGNGGKHATAIPHIAI